MSQVVIGDILPYTQAIATGGQTVFGTNWTANYESDVVVYKTPVGDDPNDVTQVLPYPAGYSVAFIGSQQDVQVTLVVPALIGERITITRQTPADRQNLYTNTNFVPSMLNNDFGILTLVDQQAQLVDQKIAPRYNYSAIIVDVVDTILPILGANQFWGKNPANTEIIAVDIASITSGGTVTQIDTGLGLTGGPITTTGTISFGPMAANSFWGNITGSSAVPTEVPTTYFLKSANNLSDLTDDAAARVNLGVEIGVDVEAWSPVLDSIAALTGGANTIPYFAAINTYGTIAAAASSVLITSAGNVPSLSQTLPLAVQDNITKLGAMVEALNMNSHQINNVTDPTNPQDAATMAYVGSQLGDYLPLVGGTMAGIISMGNHKITNLTDPSAGQDAVTVTYLNSALANYLPLSGGGMSGSIDMNSNFITELLDPVNPQDAATKNYVDTVATGLTIQPACYAASTGALTVTYNNGASGIGATLTNAGAMATFTLDGTSPAVNSRVLIWQQASALQNGIYTVTNVGSVISNWVLTRATDYDQPSEIQPGDLVIINNGSTYAGTSFIETASVSAVGTDAIDFSQFTFSATSVLLKANNLSDVANTTTSFNNISPLTTKGDLIAYNSGNVRLPVGLSDGQILQVSSGAATGLAWSTATYPVTTTVNQLLYSSSTNVVAGLATVNGAVLTTDATGIPLFLSSGSSGNVMVSNGTIWTSAAASPVASAVTIVNDITTNATMYPTWVTANSGNLPLKVSSTKLSFNPSTGTMTLTGALKSVTGIQDTNGVSVLTFTGQASADSYLDLSNAFSGVGTIASQPVFTAVGSPSNISISFQPKGDAALQIFGTSVRAATINFYENTANGFNYCQLKAAENLASSTVILTLPSTLAAGVMQSDASGILSLTTTPYLTQVRDVNGNEVMIFSGVASAVNEITFANAATGGTPLFSATGGDSDISIGFAVKGAGAYQFFGTSSVPAALNLYEDTDNGSNYVGLKAPSSVSSNITFQLPGAAAAVDNAPLVGSTAGVLSFLTLAALTKVVVQEFSASGTYTPTSGMKYCIMECVGGGGAGGGAAAAGAGAGTSGGGGGGGGYAMKVSTAATVGASQTVTIGAGGTAGTAGNNAGNNGGDTSVGTICIGKGGTGGGGSAGVPGGTPGAGGVAGTGDATWAGGNGEYGHYAGVVTVMAISSTGGHSFFGAGAPQQSANSAFTGPAGSLGGGYGGGGGGGATYNNSGTVAGGAGKAGYVRITEFVSI